jgi:hypothetical protein
MIRVVIAVSALALAGCGEPAAPVAAPEAAPAVAETVPAAANVTDAIMMSPEQIGLRLVGVFQSTQDENISLDVTSDGKWTENYVGEEPVVTTWRVFAGDQPPAGEAQTFTPGSRYLELKGEDGATYYELGHVGEDGFDMFYTGRGNRLAYSRITSPA